MVAAAAAVVVVVVMHEHLCEGVGGVVLLLMNLEDAEAQDEEQMVSGEAVVEEVACQTLRK